LKHPTGPIEKLRIIYDLPIVIEDPYVASNNLGCNIADDVVN